MTRFSHASGGNCSLTAFALAFWLLALSAGPLFAASQAAADSAAADKVTLQLKWRHQFQFAGYYAALSKGFYEQAGLDVTIVEGGPGIDPYEQVLSGQAQFGISDGGVLLRRLKGDPLVALAVIFQHSPSALLTLSESDIFGPHDLAGKTIMLSPDGEPDILAMFIQEGLKPDMFHLVEPTWDLEELVHGQVDAMAAYVTNTPYSLILRGIAYRLIQPVTYGVDFYGDGIVTSEDQVNHHRDRVNRFLKASLDGWAYAMDNPQEIIDLILKHYAPYIPRERLVFESKAMRGLILPDLIQLGHMNPGRWRHMGDTFVSLGMLDPGYSLDGLLYDSKTAHDHTKLLIILGLSLGLTLLIGSVAAWMFVLNRKLTHEIHERERAEQSLRQSQDLLRRTGEMAMVGGWRVNVEARRLEWTEAIYHIHEVEPDFQPEVDTAINFYHPEDRPILNERFNLLVREGAPYDLELRIITAKGRERWVRAQGEAERSEGRVVNVFGAFQDIDARKRAELARHESQVRWKALVSNLQAGVVVSDLKGDPIFFNPTAAKFFGASNESLGKASFKRTWSFVDYRGEAIPIETHPVLEVARTGRPTHELVLGVDRAGHERAWILCNIEPVRDVDGRLSEVITAFMDITERENARLAMREAMEQAETANRLKSEFLSNTSHELRTPLNGVLGMSDLLSETPLNEEQREYAQTIQQCARSLLELINNILDFSHMEAGRFSQAEEPFSPQGLLESVASNLLDAARAKHLELTWSRAPDVPAVLVGDVQRLQRVLRNLAANAVKFTEQGGVSIEVRREPTHCESKEVTLRFTVRDTGIGIAKGDQERIFDSFSQGDGSLDRGFGGAGLGLTIARRLVELMGGTMLLESEPGKGSVFSFLMCFNTMDLDFEPIRS